MGEWGAVRCFPFLPSFHSSRFPSFSLVRSRSHSRFIFVLRFSFLSFFSFPIIRLCLRVFLTLLTLPSAALPLCRSAAVWFFCSASPVSNSIHIDSRSGIVLHFLEFSSSFPIWFSGFFQFDRISPPHFPLFPPS